MKKGLILTVFVLLTINSRSQTVTMQMSDTVALQADTTIYQVVEHMPEYPGGIIQLLTFIRKNFKYPSVSKEEAVHGRSIFRIVVEKDGSLSNFRTIRCVNQAFEDEFRRLVSIMPKWNAGTHKGMPVRVYYTIPMDLHFQ